MKISYNEVDYDVTQDNAAVLTYPNDMMNGIYIDLDDSYMFISSFSADYEALAEDAVASGVYEIEVNDDFDPEETPHCYVINSLARFTVQAANDMLGESGGEG